MRAKVTTLILACQCENWAAERYNIHMPYTVYILQCRDKTLYTGSTNDLKKRLHAHNNLKSGARYTKARRPVALVYVETCKTRSKALKREAALKRLTRAEKLQLLKGSRVPSSTRSHGRKVEM